MMKLVTGVKRLSFKLFFVALVYSILMWFSVFLYGIFYYMYIPAIAHTRPVYLNFDSSCSKEICKFPYANVTLVKPGYNRILTRGQSYAVEIKLDMPESEANIKHGMFMIKLDMLSENGELLKSSCRSAILHYKSPLYRIIHTVLLVPAYLIGTAEEKQSLNVPLFEHYEEDQYRSTHYAHIELQAQSIEIYSANLRIHAQFTGIRYFMYYWPVFSSCVGISTAFFFFSLIAIISWFRYVIYCPSINITDQLNSSLQDLPKKQKTLDTEEKSRKMQPSDARMSMTSTRGASSGHSKILEMQKDIETLSPHVYEETSDRFDVQSPVKEIVNVQPVQEDVYEDETELYTAVRRRYH